MTRCPKIEFHERYWGNVSAEAKDFVKSLLNPDLRARWRAAIADVRALHSSLRSISSSSGGWRTGSFIDTDDDDDDDTEHAHAPQQPPAAGDAREPSDPGENEYVKVTAPEEDSDHQTPPDSESGASEPVNVNAPSDAHALKHETEAHEPLHEKVPTPLHAGTGAEGAAASSSLSPAAEAQVEHSSAPASGGAAQDQVQGRGLPDPRMPGSFDAEEEHHAHHHHHFEGGWLGMLKKLHIRQ